MKKGPPFETVAVLSIRGYRRELILQGRKYVHCDAFSELKLVVVDPVDHTAKRFDGVLSFSEALELSKTLQTLRDAGLLTSAAAWAHEDDPPILYAAKIMQYLMRENQ